jgi:predicted TIM-barrel fold metal-dependent hydrolase
MIFAREVNDSLTSLVKKLDAEVAKNKSARLGAFVVVLTSDEAATQQQLEELVKKEGIKHVSLTVGDEAGPPAYKVAKEADVTAVLYKGGVVTANHAYKKGEFNAEAADKFLADLPKIVGSKK